MNISQNQASMTGGRRSLYIPIPGANALVSPTTIIPSNAFSTGLFNYTLVHGGASAGDVKLAGNFSDGLGLRLFNQSPEYNFVNSVGDIFGSASATNHGISNTGDCNNMYFRGLSAEAPFLVRSGASFNGVQLPSRAGGSNFVVQNMVIDTPGSSGVTFNFGSGVGNYYNNVNINNVRSFNANQEGICYVGNTGSGFDVINYCTTYDNFSYNSGREGTQWEHVNALTAFRNTVVLPGQSGTAGQIHGAQVHDCNGAVGYSLYTQCPVGFNIFTNGVTFSYCYFEYNFATAFIGRSDNAYFSGSPRLNGLPITFDHCYFKWTGAGTLNHLCTVEERVGNVNWTNCQLDGITDFYLDNRAAGYTNTITGTVGSGGNTSGAITAPTIQSTVYSNYALHGVINTSNPFYGLHMGYRTP